MSSNVRGFSLRRNARFIILFVLTVLIVALFVLGGKKNVSLNSSAQKSTKESSPQSSLPVSTSPNTTTTPTTTPSSDPSSTDPKSSNPSTPPTTNPSGLASVTPIISYLDFTDSTKTTIEVDAWVPGINETSGTCTLTASNGTSLLTKQSNAYSNVQNMSCKNFFVSVSEFGGTGGEWNFKVAYTSSKAEGTSAVKSFRLQ